MFEYCDHKLARATAMTVDSNLGQCYLVLEKENRDLKVALSNARAATSAMRTVAVDSLRAAFDGLK